MLPRQLPGRPTDGGWFAGRWWAVVLFASTAGLLSFQFVTGYDVAVSLSALVGPQPFVVSRPTLNADSALFQHAGWYMTQGATPYVDVWDVKPPLIFFLTAALATLAFGNMVALFVLSAAVSALAVLATVVLTGAVVHEQTGDSVAAVAGGGAMLALPYLYTYSIHGIRPKYVLLPFGLGSLYLVSRNRPAAAGAAAAIAAGFWQFGAVFVVLVVGIAADLKRRSMQTESRPVVRAVGGAAVVTALTVLPFVVWDAFVPLVVETVVVPLYTTDSATILENLYTIIEALGYATVLLPVAVYGWVYTGRNTTSPLMGWWLGVGGVLFTLQVLVADMDGWPDLMAALVFVALGVGIAVAAQPRSSRRRWTVIGLVALSVVVGPAWVGSSLQSSILEEEPVSSPETDTPPIQTIYWHQLTPESCHYRLSVPEIRWVKTTGSDFDASHCGQWPF